MITFLTNNIPTIIYFFICVYGPSKLFHSFWAKSIILSGKNRRSPREKTPTTRKQNLVCLTWPDLGSNPQQWDDKWFRALKISGLNHLATGAAIQLEEKCKWNVFTILQQNTSCLCTWYMRHIMRKPVYAICEQQRRRSACASPQSEQHVRCSLPRQYNTSTCYSWYFKPLASLCSWLGRFESYLFANPKDRFSRDETK